MPMLSQALRLPPGETMTAERSSGARAVARCDLLGVAPYSDVSDGLYRPYLGPAHRATLDVVAGWMREAGMATHVDPAANLVGRYEGTQSDAPALLIGSHIDSVTDAGRYDGPLGIMLGIECVADLAAERKRLPFAIEVIAFGDEEGSRFPASMLCSRAVAGTLDPAATVMTGRDGVTLGDALAGFGLDVARVGEAAHERDGVLAYLEAHIEQGPVLEAEGLALGIVSGIAAQKRFAVTVTGRAGHAGTNSMPLRRDALAGAAEAILAVERIARDGPDDLVATVGRMTVAPGATNVVPGGSISRSTCAQGPMTSAIGRPSPSSMRSRRSGPSAASACRSRRARRLRPAPAIRR